MYGKWIYMKLVFFFFLFFYNDFLFWHFKQMKFHKLCDIFIHKLFSPISVSSSDEANDGNIYVSIVLKITRDNPC